MPALILKLSELRVPSKTARGTCPSNKNDGNYVNREKYLRLKIILQRGRMMAALPLYLQHHYKSFYCH